MTSNIAQGARRASTDGIGNNGDHTQLTDSGRSSSFPLTSSVVNAESVMPSTTEQDSLDDVALFAKRNSTRAHLNDEMGDVVSVQEDLTEKINELKEKLKANKEERRSIDNQRSWFGWHGTSARRRDYASATSGIRRAEKALKNELKGVQLEFKRTKQEIKMFANQIDRLNKATTNKEISREINRADILVKSQETRDLRTEGRENILAALRNFSHGFRARREAAIEGSRQDAQTQAEGYAQQLLSDGFDVDSEKLPTNLQKRIARTTALKGMYNEALKEMGAELEKAKQQRRDVRSLTPWYKICRPAVEKQELKEISFTIKRVKHAQAVLTTARKVVSQEEKRLHKNNQELEKVLGEIRKKIAKGEPEGLWAKARFDKSLTRLQNKKEKLENDSGKTIKFKTPSSPETRPRRDSQDSGSSEPDLSALPHILFAHDTTQSAEEGQGEQGSRRGSQASDQGQRSPSPTLSLSDPLDGTQQQPQAGAVQEEPIIAATAQLTFAPTVPQTTEGAGGDSSDTGQHEDTGATASTQPSPPVDTSKAVVHTPAVDLTGYSYTTRTALDDGTAAPLDTSLAVPPSDQDLSGTAEPALSDPSSLTTDTATTATTSADTSDVGQSDDHDGSAEDQKLSDAKSSDARSRTSVSSTDSEDSQDEHKSPTPPPTEDDVTNL